jgi:hypothetical protein
MGSEKVRKLNGGKKCGRKEIIIYGIERDKGE